jgi:hypothetical protein
MNRRQFVSRVSLGAAAACTTFAKPSIAEAAAAKVNVRFLGMMTFVERADRSFLVATPGQHAMNHMTHVPFLMARAGSAAAKALGMVKAPGVVPGAFDSELANTNPDEFVYRNLDNTAIEVIAGNTEAVKNQASQMAQLQKIAPGKRVRGNVEKWAGTTVTLRGGRLENSAGHPDAGKVWSFGAYSQRLTDAVNFRSEESTTIRLTSGTDVRSFRVPAGRSADLWVISAATPDARTPNPTRLEHSELFFQFLVDASPVLAACPDATGREVPPTELPYVHPTSASTAMAAGGGAYPPMLEMCFIACILFGGTA